MILCVGCRGLVSLFGPKTHNFQDAVSYCLLSFLSLRGLHEPSQTRLASVPFDLERASQRIPEDDGFRKMQAQSQVVSRLPGLIDPR